MQTAGLSHFETGKDFIIKRHPVKNTDLLTDHYNSPSWNF